MTHTIAQQRKAGQTGLRIIWCAVALIFIWSAIRPHDYFTWILEVFPAIIGAVVLAATYRSFRFTTLVYALIALHMIILMVGGHYTYAEVPIGNWIRDHFQLGRNHYDRLGHFAQGFVPAMIAREVLLRLNVIKRGRWLSVLVVSVCLAVSALYELLEWIVSVLTGSTGDAFLGTQGDVFDTQKDMALALVGAVTSLLIFSRLHDRQLGLGAQGARLPALMEESSRNAVQTPALPGRTVRDD